MTRRTRTRPSAPSAVAGRVPTRGVRAKGAPGDPAAARGGSPATSGSERPTVDRPTGRNAVAADDRHLGRRDSAGAARDDAAQPGRVERTRARPDAPRADGAQRSEWVVGESGDGQRLDNFLLRHCKAVPRSALYRLMRKRAVRVDGERAKPAQRLARGQTVALPAGVYGADASDHGSPPDWLRRDVGAAVIAVTPDYLVLDKPSGLAVHGGSGVPFGVIEVLRALRQGKDDALELAHRIDRETSGVLVLARNRPALLHFQRLLKDTERSAASFRSRGETGAVIEKAYLALLVGPWRRAAVCHVESWLVASPAGGGRRQTAFDTEAEALAASARGAGTRPRWARSRFECLESWPQASLVRVTIATGRMHQIRAQAVALGQPLVGDGLYGGEAAREAAKRLGLGRMFLHAQSVLFADRDGHTCVFHAELPDDLRAALDALPGNGDDRCRVTTASDRWRCAGETRSARDAGGGGGAGNRRVPTAPC